MVDISNNEVIFKQFYSLNQIYLQCTILGSKKKNHVLSYILEKIALEFFF